MDDFVDLIFSLELYIKVKKKKKKEDASQIFKLILFEIEKLWPNVPKLKK